MTDIDRDQLRRIVAEQADLRVLLMCLVHLTGDRSWLSDPFTPRRDVRLIADRTAGLSTEAQERIVEAVVGLMFDDQLEAAIVDPGDELMLEMMRVCLGENVAPEYAGMMREDLGFTSRLVDPPAGDTEHLEVCIVGAGVSGLALGAVLNQLGIGYQILELRDEVGGTWWDNRYPGCGVDTPNHAYSFSHGARNDWSRYFSRRDEIEDYLIRCADDFDVRRHVRFGTEVRRARWDADSARWRVDYHDANGEGRLEAAVLVGAIGVLNVPRYPDIAGLDSFEGRLVHSARWPDDLDLSGRRVAVIGTGASAMQLVPSIADEVAELTVFQRSPQWARPVEGYGDPIPDGDRWLIAHLPFYAEWFRFVMFWRYGDGLLPYLRRDPEWPHPERAMNRTNDRHRAEMTEHLLSELEGRPDLIDKCLPDYPPFGKRILIDNRWYQTLRQPHVELVTDPITEITPTGVRTAEGQERAVDVIVVATGFHTHQGLARLDIEGRGGRQLAEAWADDDPRAHLGITVPGFPNLFLMLGPNTGLGHGGSTIFVSECQARYISACVAQMAERDLAAIEVKPEPFEEWNSRVDAEHAELIWTHPGMTNWYRNAAGRITALLPFRLVDYWGATHDPDLDDYELTPRR